MTKEQALQKIDEIRRYPATEVTYSEAQRLIGDVLDQLEAKPDVLTVHEIVNALNSANSARVDCVRIFCDSWQLVNGEKIVSCGADTASLQREIVKLGSPKPKMLIELFEDDVRRYATQLGAVGRACRTALARHDRQDG